MNKTQQRIQEEVEAVAAFVNARPRGADAFTIALQITGLSTALARDRGHRAIKQGLIQGVMLYGNLYFCPLARWEQLTRRAFDNSRIIKSPYQLIRKRNVR